MVGSPFSDPGHALCPDPVPGGQRQPPCPTTKLEWKVHSKDPSQGIGREQHQRAGVAAQGKVWTSWAPLTPRISLCRMTEASWARESILICPGDETQTTLAFLPCPGGPSVNNPHGVRARWWGLPHASVAASSFFKKFALFPTPPVSGTPHPSPKEHSLRRQEAAVHSFPLRSRKKPSAA